MEIPYTGRAIINDLHNGAEIIIPAKKNLFVILFSFTWLIVSLYFAILVCTLVQGPAGANARPFIYGFLSLLLIPSWVSVIGKLWWNIAGKEIIHISQGVLTIERKGDWFKHTKNYDLTQCTNFCAFEVEMPIYHYGNRTAAMLRKKPNPGTIRFDYDVVDTIQFGDWLRQAEAEYILERLRDKKLIS